MRLKELLDKLNQSTHPTKFEHLLQPQECVDYILPPFNVPITRTPANTREKLSKVLAIVDLYKHCRLVNKCTILTFPTTSKKLLSICGNSTGVSRILDFMCVIGLIAPYDDRYSFNNACATAKQYLYYYDNEVELKKYCEENNINKFIIKNYEPTKTTKAITSFDSTQVKFSSKLHLLKPDNYTPAQFENYVTDCLYTNYPQLAHYQQLADDINTTYYHDFPELSISFTPTITWSKGNKAITKIGIRATNSLCNAKKEKDDDGNKVYKQDILDKYNLTLSKDVKSSVPRLTYSLNNNYWLPETVDCYEIIYSCYSAIDDTLSSFSEERDNIKNLHLRAYFDSATMLPVHICRDIQDFTIYGEIKPKMQHLKNAITEAEGKQYDSEIFLHESCIYLDVLKNLLDNGYFVWEQYDAFYANNPDMTQDEYNTYCTDLVATCATNYINKNY